MSGRGSYRDRLEQWLEDAPRDAPHDLLEDILRDYPTVRQRRDSWSWAIPGFSARQLAPVALGLSVMLLALAFVLLRPDLGLPNAGARATPGWAERFPTEVARTFKVPFAYAVDPASGLTQQAEDSGTDLYRFRAPSPADPEVLTSGVIVRTAGDGLREQPCTETGGSIIQDPRPRDFVDYLQTVPGLEVSKPGTAVVDGYPALTVDVKVLPNRPCNDLWVFENGGSFTEGGKPSAIRRFVALDVDGELVLIVIAAERDGFDRWLPTAQAFIDSFRFQPTGSSSP